MPAKELVGLTLNDIGRRGLNTQASPSALDPQWLTSAVNVILDQQGRISTRKGFQQVTESLTSDIIGSVFEFSKSDGTSEIICGSDAEVYTINQTTTPYIFVSGDRTQGGSYSEQTITSGRWEWANFNGKAYGVQNSHTPVRYDGTNWIDLVELGSYNPPAGITTFDPSCILGEYGRLWVGGMTEKNNVIYYSDTLQGDKWNTGSAGQIDLKTVWGGDRIMAIHAFNGYLVVFGTKNIAVYENPDDLTNIKLNELIEGIGLKARDSVAHLGDDLIFLSNSGLRSLARTVTADGKMPLKEFSKNVKDDLALHIVSADMDQCVGEYCLCGGFYILSFPDRNLAYHFDFTTLNEDGTPRVSKFEFNEGEGIHAMESTVSGTLWVGRNDSGNIAQYKNYYDQWKLDVTGTYGTQETCEAAGHTWESTNSKCWETQNQSYNCSFKTVWMDFGQAHIAKLLKRFFIVVEGGRNMDVTFNYYRDYDIIPDSQYFTLFQKTEPSLWGAVTSLFGKSKFASTDKPVEYRMPLSKSAKEVQFEMKGDIRGHKASLQNITVLAKTGKIR